MEATQISLRTTGEQAERIRVYAKANKLSVNAFLINLIENALNSIEAGGFEGELTQLVAEPIKALSRIHHKICDPWNTNEPVDLRPAEISFLTDAARKQLDSKHLTGPDYAAISGRIGMTLIESDPSYFRDLFGFAHRHYIRDEETRKTFAIDHAQMGIPSFEYAFTVGLITFRVVVRGNAEYMNDFPENNQPPTLTLICETSHFDSRHDWNTFIALVRLMNAIRNGEASQCHSGIYTRLGRRIDSQKPWSLYLGRLQLLLSETELQEIASEFYKFTSSDISTAGIIKQLRLLYGEG
ncbi:TPA: hypothetical protein ACG0NO_004151 [Enterobacter hormaechei subsp. steigerwaltii]|jgi:hypothetical protein|uniref:hypothetical protein n=1 Tax=Escherichia coli TaxID=562 RepID=UPI0005306D15|nr:hypothetical protein [Escherichia coli]EBP8466973.1 hypothetical protein [Salmonella enterica]EGD2135796.1 hypothetical protein [Escherichia coli]EIX7312504.1 hypothetical protein [Escherichia coli]EKK6573892.1 hypothetical protein [Salmonella enterica]ELO5610418.1 hypothetical protein [Escherichia coli]